MKQTRRRMNRFAFYNPAAIETELADMAARGWMLEKPGGFTWKYRKSEPRQLRFAVTYFPDTSAYDPEKSEEALARMDFCAQDGWTFLCDWGAMQIFYTEDLDAVPIDTDPEIQVETIFRTMKKNTIYGQVSSLVLGIYMLVFQYMQFSRDPLDYLSKPTGVYLLPLWGLYAVAALYQILFCLRWRRRARKAAADGWFLPPKGKDHMGTALLVLTAGFLLLAFRQNGGTFAVFGMVWLGIMAVIGLAATRLRSGMKKRGVRRNVNKAVTIIGIYLLCIVSLAVMVAVVLRSPGGLTGSKPVGTYTYGGGVFDRYDDQVHLTVEQLTAVDGQWSKRAREQWTVLLFQGKYRLDEITGKTYDMSYTVYDYRQPWVGTLCRASLLELDWDDIELFDIHYEPLTQTHGADAIYQRWYGEDAKEAYLIFYPTRAVELRLFDGGETCLPRAVELLTP